MAAKRLACGLYPAMNTHTTPSGQEFHRRSDDALRRALGPDILAALANDQVVEVMLNPAGDLWTDSQGFGMQCIGRIDRVRAMSIVSTVAAMLACGIPMHEAMVHANRAGGIVVGKFGTANVSYEELFA